MNCKKIQKLLSQYIVGQIKETIKQKIDSHLSVCPKCKLEYQDLLKVKNILGSLPALDLPPNYIENVEKEAARRISKEELSPFRKTRWLIPTLGTVVVMLLVLFLSNRLPRTRKLPDSIKVYPLKTENINIGTADNPVTSIYVIAESSLCNCWYLVKIYRPQDKSLISKDYGGEGFGFIRGEFIKLSSQPALPEEFVFFVRFIRGNNRVAIGSNDKNFCRVTVQGQNKLQYKFRNPDFPDELLDPRSLTLTVIFQGKKELKNGV